MIAVCRMSRGERTRFYMAKRIAEGKTKKEIIRCLNRYIARETTGTSSLCPYSDPRFRVLDEHRSIT